MNGEFSLVESGFAVEIFESVGRELLALGWFGSAFSLSYFIKLGLASVCLFEGSEKLKSGS